MRLASDAGMLTLIHCEDAAILADAMSAWSPAAGPAPKFYPQSRPITAEVAATARAVAFAEQTGAPAYIVHLSCAGGARRGAPWASPRASPLWIETRPLYLFLTEERFAEPDAGKYFGQPPLRTPADRAALWQALADGEIDTVAPTTPPGSMRTRPRRARYHHDPPRRRRPRRDAAACSGPRASPTAASPGSASSRHRRPTPPSMLGLYPRKGTIAPGSDADLVLWDPDASKPVRAADFASNCDYSPYEGWAVTGWPG